MRIGAYRYKGKASFGIPFEGSWIDLPGYISISGVERNTASPLGYLSSCCSLEDDLRKVRDTVITHRPRFRKAVIPIEKTEFLPPLYPGGRLFTQRGNSCLFSKAVGIDIPEHPVWERRFSSIMVGHNHICKKVGHGCNPEFVAVIGKEAKNVKKENARDFILGYTLMIDHAGSPPVFMEDWGMSEYQEEMTLRDHFFHSSYYGNTTCPHPVGPWVVTKEEISDPYNLWISAEEKYEDIRLIEMVSSGSSLFRFEEAVSFMSSIFTLKPGDMISSSSIGYDGYAFRREIIPGSWFQASCSGIGSLRMYLTGKK